MNGLQVYIKNGAAVTDSREVARMVGKQHKHLMRDIEGYVEHMSTELKNELSEGQPNFGPSDFFVESSYISEQNKKLPCYDITRKGCDFIANKLTGRKGTLFTASYITAFCDMESHIKTGSKLSDGTEKIIAMAKLNNSRARASSQWLKIGNEFDSPIHRQICASYASQELAGTMVIALPETGKTYSATEIGVMLGISANKVGSLANKHNLKTDQYGVWVMDKSKHSVKEVNTFRYFDSVIPIIKRLAETA